MNVIHNAIDMVYILVIQCITMNVISARVKKWGNSLGVIIPSETVDARNIKENEEIRIIIVKDSGKVLRETFGLLKGKITKSGQQIKDELRRELY